MRTLRETPDTGCADNQRVSVEHYENFPVASLLCPAALRPAVVAIYVFARTADDLADEGDAAPAQRLDDLRAFRNDLHTMVAGGAASKRWPAVFGPLRAALVRHQLPVPLLTDLLDAFEQDVFQPSYTNRDQLLDYCRRSANPVGRLLLHLHGVAGDTELRRSDAVCSALQLINFWQDMGVDARRGRVYAPADDCARFGLTPQDVLNGRDSPAMRRLVAELVGWSRELMLSGAPLVHQVPGRAGWELRLVVQGGLRILDKVEKLQYATLHRRPTLRWHDVPVMLWRALWMRRPPAAALGAVA